MCEGGGEVVPVASGRDLEVGSPEGDTLANNEEHLAEQNADEGNEEEEEGPQARRKAARQSPPPDASTAQCFARGADGRSGNPTGKSILIEFRDFVLGGNLIRMAVAFVLALALERMVSQFVASFITPVLGIIGTSDFKDLKFTIRGSVFAYGEFLDSAISFLVVCTVLFFCLILPVQRYGGRCVPSWIIRKCPFCFSDMPAVGTRCRKCTSTITPLLSVKTA